MALQSNVQTTFLSDYIIVSNSYSSPFMVSASDNDPLDSALPMAPVLHLGASSFNNMVDIAGLQESHRDSEFCMDESKSVPLGNLPPAMGQAHQYTSISPMAQCISSFHKFFLPFNIAKQNIDSQTMAMYITIERNHDKSILIPTLPSHIFPNSSLPFPVNANLLSKLEGLWDPKKIQLAPPKAYTEVAVEEWLEMIGLKMSQATAIPCSSRWWSLAYKNSPVPDGELNRKPHDVHKKIINRQIW